MRPGWNDEVGQEGDEDRQNPFEYEDPSIYSIHF